MLKKWLFKIDRIIIWPLLIVTLLFLFTGFSVTHEAYRIIPLGVASEFHVLLHFIFIPLFLAHAIIGVYFAVNRWKKKAVNASFFVQLERFSAWVLLVAVMLYMFSGYVMSGRIPLDISVASRIHRSLDVVIIVFLLHAGVRSYCILRKWLRS